METIVDMVEALSWPIAAIALALLLRKEVTNLILRLKSLKYGEFEARFHETMRAVEPETEAAQLGINTESTQLSDEIQRERDQLRLKARTSPRGAILESWLLLEDTANELGLTETGDPVWKAIPRYLQKKGIHIHASTPTPGLLFVKLRILRNQAVHLPDFAVSADDAEKYLVWATNLTDLMKKAR